MPFVTVKEYTMVHPSGVIEAATVQEAYKSVSHKTTTSVWLRSQPTLTMIHVITLVDLNSQLKNCNMMPNCNTVVLKSRALVVF